MLAPRQVFNMLSHLLVYVHNLSRGHLIVNARICFQELVFPAHTTLAPFTLFAVLLCSSFHTHQPTRRFLGWRTSRVSSVSCWFTISFQYAEPSSCLRSYSFQGPSYCLRTYMFSRAGFSGFCYFVAIHTLHCSIMQLISHTPAQHEAFRLKYFRVSSVSCWFTISFQYAEPSSCLRSHSSQGLVLPILLEECFWFLTHRVAISRQSVTHVDQQQ